MLKHSTKIYERYGEKCDIRVGTICVSSEKNQTSDVIDIDPEYSLQDVVRCHLCKTPIPPLHCDVWNLHLCEDCEEIHLSDEFIEHKMVQFKYRGSMHKCHNHSSKNVIVTVKNVTFLFVPFVCPLRNTRRMIS